MKKNRQITGSCVHIISCVCLVLLTSSAWLRQSHYQTSNAATRQEIDFSFIHGQVHRYFPTPVKGMWITPQGRSAPKHPNPRHSSNGYHFPIDSNVLNTRPGTRVHYIQSCVDFNSINFDTLLLKLDNFALKFLKKRENTFYLLDSDAASTSTTTPRDETCVQLLDGLR